MRWVIKVRPVGFTGALIIPFEVTEKEVLKSAIELGQKLGFTCLSHRILPDEQLFWSCKERGHVFCATLKMLQYGLVCHDCKTHKASKNAKQQQRLSRSVDALSSKGARLESWEVVNNRLTLKTSCRDGHSVSILASELLRNGFNCPQCEMLAAAVERNLAKQNVENVQFIVRCAAGHVFKSDTPECQISWTSRNCPKCTEGDEFFHAEKLREIEKQSKFTCRARSVGARAKVKWKCPQNHIFTATPLEIKQGRKCPHCLAALAPAVIKRAA